VPRARAVTCGYTDDQEEELVAMGDFDEASLVADLEQLPDED
jgi:hypothetical protein